MLPIGSGPQGTGSRLYLLVVSALGPPGQMSEYYDIMVTYPSTSKDE